MIESSRIEHYGVALLRRKTQHLEGVAVPYNYLELRVLHPSQKFVFLTIVLLVEFALCGDCLGIAEDDYFLLEAETIVDVKLARLDTLRGIFKDIQTRTDSKCSDLCWKSLQQFDLRVFLEGKVVDMGPMDH